MARERNGETASAARERRSRGTRRTTRLSSYLAPSVSTLVAMVTGGRARARSDCWRRDETRLFCPSLPRLRRLPHRVSARSALDAAAISARNREPTSDRLSRTPGADFKRNETREKARYFCCTPWKRRLGLLRASVAVRALPPVAMASRSVLRRGIAAFAEATRRRRRQRARAPGRSHREQVRRACVTKYSSAHRARPNRRRARPVAADPHARDPRRVACLATADVSAVERGRSRGPLRAAPEPIARRRSAKAAFFVLSRTGRASRPFLAPARERGPRSHQSVGRRFLSCFFFGVPKKNVASFIVSHETDRLKTPTRRPIRAHHRLSPVHLSHLSYERTRRATNLKNITRCAPFLWHRRAEVADAGRRAPSRRRAGSPRTRRTSPRTKSCRSPACRRR